MRRETREYNLDWVYWSVFDNASKVYAGSEKEYQILRGHLPHLDDILQIVKGRGDVGTAFLKMVANYLKRFLTAKERGRKVAMATAVISPAIFVAMDIEYIALEILSVMGGLLWEDRTSDYMDFCIEVGFTETSCSAQRASLGAYLAGVGVEPDFVVNSVGGSCDTNANAFAFASVYLNKPFYQIDTPPELTPQKSTDYHTRDYRSFIAFLEEQTGEKLDEDRLREVLEEVRIQDEIIGEIEELQLLTPNPVPVEFNFFIYVSVFTFSGSKEATKVLRMMLEESRENAKKGVSGLKSGEEKCRGLFCWIDHFTSGMKFWEMLDRNGISNMGNILNRSWSENSPLPRHLGDKTESYRIGTRDLDEMIETIAAINARMPMAKSVRGPYDSPNMWLEDNLALAKIYNVDFVAYNGTPGCRNSWGAVKLFARAMEKHGVPAYIMSGDAFDDRVESWQTTEARFEEFLRVRKLI
ncbi:MAG: 2-hydroxyacyl-CoA dehydratase [Desulfobacterales bacterium]|nr:2-hydroxyacyl-CoA dehydratase [Desulfobacterales bacterium]